MASLVIVLLISYLIPYATCEPSVSFPINSQLPPVARVDEPFSYQFSPYTFKSDSNLTYSLGEAPSWLAIDGENRRLYGTPKDSDVPSGDVVGQSIEIVANDGSGTASLNATLVVSRNTGPKINVPISEQVGDFGDYSAPSSLLSYPSTEFEYAFESDTFEQDSGSINYYATSDDSSPLPAWMKFDSETLTFQGKTPPFESLIQPPQTFGFKLVASDIVGFSAASVSFSIVVGSHKLTAKNPTLELNATRGKKFSYSGLQNSIKLDSRSPKTGELNISTSDMPDWLSLDSTSWELKGTPGKSDHSTNFTLRLSDEHSDTLNIAATVNVATGLFRSTFDDVTAKAGEEFNLDLQDYFWDPDDIKVAIQASPQQSWLKLNNLSLSGKIPATKKGSFNISVAASSKSSDISETEVLNVKLLAATSIDSATASSTDTFETPSTTSTTPAESSAAADATSNTTSHSLSKTSLILAILMPIMALAVVLLLVACCLIHRRRSRRTYLSKDFRDKISGPVLDSLQVNGSSPTMQKHGASKLDQHMYRPGREGYAEVISQISTPSSPSVDSLVTPALPAGFLAENTGYGSSSFTATEGRQSWVTVDGTATATARRSETSSESHRSDTTFPESTHQLIPPPAFLPESGSNSFRSGLDLAIPSLEDLSSIQSEGAWRRAQLRQTGGSSDFFSTSRASSLVFDSTHQSSPRLDAGPYTNEPSGAVADMQPLERSLTPSVRNEQLADTTVNVVRPSAVRLSSQHSLSRHINQPWTEVSSNGRYSYATDPSFTSEENWRVFSPGNPTKPKMENASYQDLVDEAPYHPSRPGTSGSPDRDGAQPGERNSMELMLPTRLADGQTSARASSTALGHSSSRLSQLSGQILGKAGSKMSQLGRTASTNWRREDSGKASNGSFKAFI